MVCILNEAQYNSLMSEQYGEGGFQSLMRNLQNKIKVTKAYEIELDNDQVEKINRYANDYKNGGWQSQLKFIFPDIVG